MEAAVFERQLFADDGKVWIKQIGDAQRQALQTGVLGDERQAHALSLQLIRRLFDVLDTPLAASGEIPAFETKAELLRRRRFTIAMRLTPGSLVILFHVIRPVNGDIIAVDPFELERHRSSAQGIMDQHCTLNEAVIQDNAMMIPACIGRGLAVQGSSQRRKKQERADAGSHGFSKFINP
ncbi:MAG: hypothetical protein BWY83_02893 [bacterium ADurb.Bin478]|nr:MAG: hypothetical protein BWY83_02893 [bacterium ADurb.Bin478]